MDSGGRVVSATDPLAHRTVREFDGLNQLIEVTDPLGGVTSFAYDGAGNLRTVTDARDNLTTFTYDNMDRLVTRRDALNNIESYDYDGNGNLVRLTDRKGQVTTFGYDGLNRRTFAGFGTVGSTYTSTIDYTYDAGNRITSIADSRGGTITRTFDGLDRLTQEITPNSPANGIQYTYDAASRRQSMTVGCLAPVTYGYNAADQLTSVAQGATVSLAYDGAGRPKTVTLPDGIVETYSYDDASELTGITYTSGSTTLGDLFYGYDQAGRRTAVWGGFARTGLPATTTQAASYNANNQLTAWNGTSLTYDPNGNPTAFGSREVADEIGRAWPRFASAFATRGPLVIAVEDLHWAGDQLLDMLERIVARSSGPVVLVATARPEFAQSHPGFAAGREDASSISLRPLTQEQGVRLVEGLLAVADIPADFREDLLAKAEGNPFFLEEIIRRLIDEGARQTCQGHRRGNVPPAGIEPATRGLGNAVPPNCAQSWSALSAAGSQIAGESQELQSRWSRGRCCVLRQQDSGGPATAPGLRTNPPGHDRHRGRSLAQRSPLPEISPRAWPVQFRNLFRPIYLRKREIGLDTVR